MKKPKIIKIKPIKTFTVSLPKQTKKKTLRNPTFQPKSREFHATKVHFNLDSDRDGVPDFKDCRPFDPRYHSSAQIEKAKQMFGTTRNPHKAGWILPSGEFLNMSDDNIGNVYGNQPIGRQQVTSDNQIAHWEVGKAIGVSGRAANRIFEGEGAIRFRKTPGRGMYVQMVKKPTREQALAIAKAMQTEPIPTFVYFERVSPSIKGQAPPQTMQTEKVHPIMLQKFISQVF